MLTEEQIEAIAKPFFEPYGITMKIDMGAGLRWPLIQIHLYRGIAWSAMNFFERDVTSDRVFIEALKERIRLLKASDDADSNHIFVIEVESHAN